MKTGGKDESLLFICLRWRKNSFKIRTIKKKRLIVCPEWNVIVEDLDPVTLGIRCPDLYPVNIAHLGGNR
jgi:hypothetical protein